MSVRGYRGWAVWAHDIGPSLPFRVNQGDA
jgi:hypothetical protein